MKAFKQPQIPEDYKQPPVESTEDVKIIPKDEQFETSTKVEDIDQTSTTIPVAEPNKKQDLV